MFVEDREAWEAHVSAGGGPVVQGWDWGRARELEGHRVWRLADPSGVALQAVGTRWRGVPVAWVAGGPLLDGGSPTPGLGRRLRSMAWRLRRPMVLAPHGWGSAGWTAAGCPALPARGYVPATVLVDLGGGRDALLAGLHGTWRNQYRTGAARCSRVVLGHDPADLERVAALFRAGSGDRPPDVDVPTLDRLARSFGPGLELSVAADDDGDVTAAVVLHGTVESLLLGHDPADLERVAALFRAGSGDRPPDVDVPTLDRLARSFGPGLELSVAADDGGDVTAAVVLHGTVESLLLGLATTPAGRGRNGANLLVFEAMAASAESGRRRFDLGGVADAGAGDGIGHFKARAGGVLVEHGAPFLAVPVPW